MYVQDLRPKDLNSVIGNKKVIKELKTRSLTLDFPMTSLFSGNSGTGKTTLASIVAMTINCEKPIKHEDRQSPCLECDSCKQILSENYSGDVQFFDASAMSKDDVLELESLSSYNPIFGKSRIIIIDEAQALSSVAKGALLKLLEKKKKNLYLMLLTMAEEKFDKSILDRCNRFYLKGVSSTEISTYLFSLLESIDPDEKIPESFVTEGIVTIANNCEGSVRKAVQDFEKAIYGELYTKEDLINVIGYQDEDTMLNTLMSFINRDSKFLSILKAQELQKFFNYSWTVLLNIKEKVVTCEDLNPMEKVIANNLNYLLPIYTKTVYESGSYLNNNIFKNHILDYLMIKENTEAPVMKRTRRLAE